MKASIGPSVAVVFGLGRSSYSIASSVVSRRHTSHQEIIDNAKVVRQWTPHYKPTLSACSLQRHLQSLKMTARIRYTSLRSSTALVIFVTLPFTLMIDKDKRKKDDPRADPICYT